MMFSLLVIAVVLGLASAQCGVKPNKDFNIVGGSNADPNEWPWQLSMQSSSGSHFCGGSLIDAEWAITAAHCVEGSTPSSFRFVAGEHDRGSSSGREQTLFADSYAMHPDYNFPSNDVAVVHLSNAADLNEYVNVACPPSLSADYPSYSNCYISGWGYLEGGDFILPDTLQEVPIDVLSSSECRSYWGGTIPDYDSVFCVYDVAGGNSGDTGGCNGDSGGPLSCQNPSGSWDVIGAASFVATGCITSYPTGYGNLQDTWDFIQGETGIEPSS